MTQATIDRYQPGGDIWLALASQYGENGANAIATAALTGDEKSVNKVLVQVKYGNPLNDNTFSIFTGQILNDPFGAPLASLDNQLSKVLGSGLAGVLSNPWVLLLSAGLIGYVLYKQGIIEKLKKLE